MARQSRYDYISQDLPGDDILAVLGELPKRWGRMDRISRLAVVEVGRVLLAYGLAYPNRLVYLYFMFPIKVKYFVGFLAAVAFWASIQAGASTVSHLTHLSGMVIGWVYLRAKRRTAAPQLLARINDLKKARRIAREAQENREDDLLRRQVDEILDKINTRGYDSLTSTEQDLLYRASVRFSRKTDKD